MLQDPDHPRFTYEPEGTSTATLARLNVADVGLVATASLEPSPPSIPQQTVPIRRIGAEGLVSQQSAINLTDLSVESTRTRQLVLNRFVAYVDVQLPTGTVVHRGLRAWVKLHLDGRNPVVFEEDGWLRTGFAVDDHSPATMSQVAGFALQMGELFATDQFRYIAVRLPDLSLESAP